MLIGALLLGGFWALVIALSIAGRRLTAVALALVTLLIAALALQPRVHAAGWAALVLTVLVVAVMAARPVLGDGDDDGDDADFEI